MIEIITSYNKPYCVMLHTEGMGYILEDGFTNKRLANKCRTKWRNHFRRIHFNKLANILSQIKSEMQALEESP